MTENLTNDDEPLDTVALNEGLMLSLVRQHELTEAAELLNAQLHAEIAARKKVEEALVDSEKLASAGRMAAVLAHEINNPLEAVTNILYLALTTEGIPDAVRGYLKTAEGELKRIAHITRQTLGFYRESSSATTAHIAPLLDSVCDLLQAKVASKHAIVKRQCDGNLELNAFQGELRQVLANFLLNSLDAVSDGGRVTLRAAASPGFRDGRSAVRVTVADDGQGMTPEVMEKIFTPFFTTKGSVGNGLGLWVSKQIIEKHGGSIQVHSCRTGVLQGTTVSVLLPAGPLSA